MRLSLQGLIGCAVLACALPAAAQDPGSRGQLLYDTHCLDCHNEQMHWRGKRLVGDWLSLKAWVGHWQREARLEWSDDDIAAVARYLNATIYRFPEPQAAR